jgi:hypothetical protein
MQLSNEDIIFLGSITSYCSKNPQIIPYVSERAYQGLNNYLEQERFKRSELELCLSTLLMKKCPKETQEFVFEKLLQHGEFLNWKKIVEGLNK